jgi:hypothetical protein
MYVYSYCLRAKSQSNESMECVIHYYNSRVFNWFSNKKYPKWQVSKRSPSQSKQVDLDLLTWLNNQFGPCCFD